MSPYVLNWCKYEWFYSHVDLGFFQHSEFGDIITQIGDLNTEENTLEIWKSLKMTLGRPRRFSPAFLAGERGKLSKTREAMALIQQGKLSSLP